MMKLSRRKLLLWGAGVILSSFVMVFFLVRSFLYEPVIWISAEPIDGANPDPLQSRFFPQSFYFPKNETHPADPEGRPMVVLAQLNFSEMPKLKGYPETGILQIFLSAYDDLYGWDGVGKGAKKTGYHLRYFPEVNSSPETRVTDFSFLPDPNSKGIDLPVSKDCRLSFRLREDVIAWDDSNFEASLVSKAMSLTGPFEDDVREWHYQLGNTEGPCHQIGGFPDFVQSDPRGYLDDDKEWVLLFQMDSDRSAGVNWGDSGIGNFYISKQALADRDFSDVRYEYACY